MQNKIKQLRRDVLLASYDSGACHIGSALSCIEILVKIFYEYGFDKEKDTFVFGKASGVSAMYAMLADKGYFPKEKIAEYLKEYPLSSKEVPGIIHSFGSVGHGLSVASGIALGNKLKNKNGNVYVLLSDGDFQEGSTYESCLFVKQHKLDNLCVFVDNNGLQACGKTKEILDLEDTWDFLYCILPVCHIIKTTKGKGVSFMENDYKWHYNNLTKDLLEIALKENE